MRYRFEPMKFRLADLAFYAPDLQVRLPEGTIEFHEVNPGYRKELKGRHRARRSVLHPGLMTLECARIGRDILDGSGIADEYPIFPHMALWSRSKPTKAPTKSIP